MSWRSLWSICLVWPRSRSATNRKISKNKSVTCSQSTFQDRLVSFWLLHLPTLTWQIRMDWRWHERSIPKELEQSVSWRRLIWCESSLIPHINPYWCTTGMLERMLSTFSLVECRLLHFTYLTHIDEHFQYSSTIGLCPSCQSWTEGYRSVKSHYCRAGVWEELLRKPPVLSKQGSILRHTISCPQVEHGKH